MAAINSVQAELEAIEWRRKCVWLSAYLRRAAGNLQDRFPSWEQTIREILEPLDCYANLVFKSAEDLRTVFTCLGLIVDIFEEIAKLETPSSMDLWQKNRPLIDDLETLESGDPPVLSSRTTHT